MHGLHSFTCGPACFLSQPSQILSNVYLVSLALTDLLTGLLVMPLACYYTVVGEWMLGGIACKVSGVSS